MRMRKTNKNLQNDEIVLSKLQRQGHWSSTHTLKLEKGQPIEFEGINFFLIGQNCKIYPWQISVRY